MSTLYDVTGNIADINTVLVNRGELRRLVKAADDVYVHRYQSGAPLGVLYEELKYAAQGVNSQV